jgi:2-polyprenyl-3-methyl-5-hydroxy-6-metoxy-1,4-benzoquinol methylase
VYSNPRPTEQYKLERYRMWSQNERQWSAEAHFDHRQQLRHFLLYRKVMRLIHERVPAGRILDVGCGGGLFLVFAGVFLSDDHTGINSAYQSEGAAFDPQEAELAHRISGAPVHLISELRRLPAGSYDAITLLNVLEHVNRPVELLSDLRRLLKPGGPLAVVVPNNELAFLRLRHGLGRQPASLWAHEHLNHFRPDTLRALLEKTGFGSTRLVPADAAGTYGSMAKLPPAQRLKHALYRTLDACTRSRVYWYAELTAVAE